MGLTMDYKEECDVAIMVYNYLIEQRLAQVAEEFSKASPFLPHIRRCPRGCMYLTAPLRSLQEVVREYVALHRNMKLLLMKHHREVSLPHENTTWEKVQHVVEYFRSKVYAEQQPPPQTQPECLITVSNTEPADANTYIQPNEAAGAEPETRHNRLDSFVVQDATGKPVAQLQNDPIIYQFAEPHRLAGTVQLPATQLHEEHFVYQVADGSQREVAAHLPSVVGQNAHGQPMVLYVVNDNDGSVVESCRPPMTLTYQQDDVTVGQHVEIRTEMVGSASTPATLHSLPVLTDEPDANASRLVLAAAPPLDSNPLAQAYAEMGAIEQQQVVEYAGMEVQPAQQPPEPTPTADPAQPTLASAAPAQPSAQKRKVDPGALEEWNRIRSINRSNFDQHVREAIHQEEVRKRIALVLDDKQRREQSDPKHAGKRKPTKSAKKTLPGVGAVTAITAIRTKSPRTIAKKCTVRMKQAPVTPDRAGKAVAVKVAPAPASASAAAAAHLDSDSSEFASSDDDEEADVREMVQNVKRYRRQQGQQQKQRGKTKEKQTKAESTSQSNTYSTPLQCRINMVVGRSPRTATVKRTIRNRTPSTSPASTPLKRAKQQPSEILPPVTPRLGTARQQQLKAKKQPAAPPAVQPKPPAPLAEATAGSNRRPVRACAAAAARRSNENAMVAPLGKEKAKSPAAPLKPPSPANVENVPPLPPPPGDVIATAPLEEASATPATKQPAPTPLVAAKKEEEKEKVREEKKKEEEEEQDTPTGPAEEVEVGEAAIYAVLAQLHGDD
ncbi:nucleolar and coiled-body phosphoprotein 1-like isoform X2 [Anopheles merus]|uniref:LisH domain-containing protein n=1 Tax=Anopheles merus TaxID=30066 RepID=A0A182VM71_ANOME|nr:nucleolar and coiled-body phosphoprotein 1-like isoform X2 [Anopheles merus]